ncbi:MAG: DNA polymerase I, partial [Acetobacter sp.]|nr:DNA polymerase I [Acetobacter sp.]
MSQTPHLILVDASGFIFRAFYALPPMTSPEGVPVNAVYGFTTMLARLLHDMAGTHFAVVFDSGRQTFRTELYAGYKAHRPEMPEELRPQINLIREATQAFGLRSLEMSGWEADDLIASYATAIQAIGGTCTLISSDKDLMQLVGEKIKMYDPIKQKTIDIAEVEAKFGVPPEKVAEVQALMGDSTDNVPGVPGIGQKTAAALITDYGTLEQVLASVASMKPSKRRTLLQEHAESARLSLRLVTLARDVPLPVPIEELTRPIPQQKPLLHWLERMGFRSVIARITRPQNHPQGEGKTPQAHLDPSSPIPSDNLLEGESALSSVLSEIMGVPYGVYETVRTAEALQTWVEKACEKGLCAVDTETNGLDPLKADLVGFSLAYEPGKACYVPLGHEYILDNPTGLQLDVSTALKIMKPLFENPAVL